MSPTVVCESIQRDPHLLKLCLWDYPRRTPSDKMSRMFIFSAGVVLRSRYLAVTAHPTTTL